MTIAYTTCPSPFGELLLAASRDGLTLAWFDGQKHRSAVPDHWRDDARAYCLPDAVAQLTAWFAGQRTDFDLPLAPEGTAFQRAVWREIAGIGFGQTDTYGAIAKRLGEPDAARAVGAATGRNPHAIIVPCHRVMGSNGALTGYAGGLERKRALLAFESGQPALI